MNGAATEYEVAAFYLKQGYQVYWPSVQQTAVDFVIGNGASLYRVQVKRATWNKASGPNRYLQVRLTNKGNQKYRRGDFDLLVVAQGEHLWEIPIAEALKTTSLCLRREGPTVRSTDTKWKDYKIQ